MTELAVLCPTRGRAHQLERLAKAFADTTTDYRILFIVNHDDPDSYKAASKVGDVLVSKRQGYAPKLNAGVRATTESLLFLGSDDVKPHRGWLETAKSYLSDTIGYVSCNDLGNEDVMAGRYATMPLVARWYAELDDELYHEGYRHNCADVEASERAQARGAFVYAPAAIVEHMHFLWGKGEVDRTYTEWALDPQGITADHALLNERRRLWA